LTIWTKSQVNKIKYNNWSIK